MKIIQKVLKMKDKVIVCKNCKNNFIFSVGEQKFYQKKCLVEPTHCKECLIKKKNMTDEDYIKYMLRKFKRNTIKINNK